MPVMGQAEGWSLLPTSDGLGDLLSLRQAGSFRQFDKSCLTLTEMVGVFLTPS